MKRFLAIVIWGVAIWGLSLVWPAVNAALTPRIADALVVGLVVALSVYFLGRQFNQPTVEPAESLAETEPVSHTSTTRPSVRVRRAAQPTRPIPELIRAEFHSRATQPVQVMAHASTRPMPAAR